MSKTVLMTGASRGIGLELARQYAGAGWQAHVGARSPRQVYFCRRGNRLATLTSN